MIDYSLIYFNSNKCMFPEDCKAESSRFVSQLPKCNATINCNLPHTCTPSALYRYTAPVIANRYFTPPPHYPVLALVPQGDTS